MTRKNSQRYRNMRNGARGLREVLWQQDPHCCYCGVATLLKAQPKEPRLATLEHFIPLSLGGTNRRENVAIACLACNQRRGDRGGRLT